MRIKIAAVLTSAAMGVGVLFGYVASVTATTTNAWNSPNTVTGEAGSHVQRVIELNPRAAMTQEEFPCEEDEVLAYDPRLGTEYVGCIHIEALPPAN